MQIDQLHITHIYQGLLACSNIRRYNERFLKNIEGRIHSYLPTHAPLYTIIPASAPDTLPRYLCILLLNGTPKEREEERDPNGEHYNGHWLGVVTFIDEPTPESISQAITQAKSVFTTHAQGYFF